MVIQFTLQELMIFLVCALGIAVGALSIPILWNLKKIVGTLRSLVETNQESINKSIRTMPGIFENAEQISSDVRETTDKLKGSVPTILGDVESVTHTAKGSLEFAGVVMENVGSGINDTISAYKRETSSIMNYFQIIEEILEIICRVFSSAK
jgi:methyl-accepting chemotaxis protein